jgi:hypothetical protein
MDIEYIPFVVLSISIIMYGYEKLRKVNFISNVVAVVVSLS